MQTLLKTNTVARHRVLEVMQERLSAEHDLKTAISQQRELAEGEAELQAKIEHHRSQLRMRTMEALTEATQQRDAMEQEIVKAEVRTKAQILLAPEDGVVQQLAIHTIGGVVAPAQELMFIVPDEETLEIENKGSVRSMPEQSQLDNLRAMRLTIEASIPVGFNMHKTDRARESTIRALSGGLDRILGKHKKIYSLQKRSYQTWIRQIGTLGGSNHFIKLCLDESDDVWVMLHSGSRGVDNDIGQHFIELARKDMGTASRQFAGQGPGLLHGRVDAL